MHVSYYHTKEPRVQNSKSPFNAETLFQAVWPVTTLKAVQNSSNFFQYTISDKQYYADASSSVGDDACAPVFVEFY